MLDDGHFLTLVIRGQCSMPNTEPAQFDLILPTTIVGTFLLFKMGFNVVKFASTFFQLLLPYNYKSL